MAENKNFNSDEIEVIENAIAAELTKNDDIIEYIQPSNLERLKARYAAIEEDESIRNEGFELAKKKQRPESTAFDYLAAPVNPRDEIRTNVNSPLSRVFNETKSEFDADIASFADISVDTLSQPTADEKTFFEPPAEPLKRKRGRPRKNPIVPIEEKKEDSATEPAPVETPPTINNRYGFDTHTRVIYVDESADDGIKRNSEEELSQAFTDDTDTKKRRLFPWSRKRK